MDHAQHSTAARAQHDETLDMTHGCKTTAPLFADATPPNFAAKLYQQCCVAVVVRQP